MILLIALLFCISVAIAYKFLFTSSSGSNPYSIHKADGSAVQKQATLKNKWKKVYTAATVQDKKFDYIIIGSGISGLASASILAKSGYKVLVLEQNGTLGGAMHTFGSEKVGSLFETGLHYIANMEPTALDYKLLQGITDGKLGSFTKLDECFDHIIIGDQKYELPFGMEHLQKKLIHYFPSEEQKIVQFLKRLQKADSLLAIAFIYKSISPLWLSNIFYSIACWIFPDVKKSLGQVLDELNIKPGPLRSIFMYMFMNIAEDPQHVNFCSYAKVFLYFYKNGAYKPNLGSYDGIAKPIIETIEKYDGMILSKAMVESIIVEDGVAKGVKMEKDGQIILADKIISSTSFVNTYKKMIAEDVQQQLQIPSILKQINTSELTFMCFVFLTISGTKEELQIPNHNVWLYPKNNQQDIALSLQQYYDSNGIIAPENGVDIPCLYISFPKLEQVPTDRQHCLALFPVKQSWFAPWQKSKPKKRGQDYDEFKQQLCDRALHLIQNQYPQFESKICNYMTGSPLTCAKYYNAYLGAVYGSIANNANRFDYSLVRPDNGIVKGLYLVGQDVVFAGFSAALWSAHWLCCILLKRNLYADLKNQ